jgi:hypothetical protein
VLLRGWCGVCCRPSDQKGRSIEWIEPLHFQSIERSYLDPRIKASNGKCRVILARYEPEYDGINEIEDHGGPTRPKAEIYRLIRSIREPPTVTLDSCVGDAATVSPPSCVQRDCSHYRLRNHSTSTVVRSPSPETNGHQPICVTVIWYFSGWFCPMICVARTHPAALEIW